MRRSPTVPVCGSHSKPPLQPPSKHELGPGLEAKLQSRLPYIIIRYHIPEKRCLHTQILPAFQLSGTVKETAVKAPASHPVAWLGATFPATFKSVNIFEQTISTRMDREVVIDAHSRPNGKGAGIVDLAYDEYLLDQGKGSKSITVIVLALATETKQNATREENCMVRSRRGDELVVQLKD